MIFRHSKALMIEEKLIASDSKKLIETLLHLYQTNQDVQKKIDIIFADIDKDSAKIVCAIKKEISALEKSVRFIDYDEADYVAKDLDNLRLRIVNEIYNKSPQLAFDSMLEFVDAHEAIFDRVFDDNGIFLEVFMEAYKDLGRIAQEVTHLSLEEMVDIVFLRWMKSELGVYEDLIANFKDVLQEKGLALLEDKLKQALDEENKIRIEYGLKEIADCNNDVDAFIQACSFVGEINDHDHLEIAKRLINHQRGKEALDWLDRVDLSYGYLRDEDKSKLKIQAFEVEKEYEKAQNERLSLFKKNLKVEMYNDILAHAISSEFQESFKAEAIEMAFIFEPHRGLDFLIEIKELQQAAQFVHLKYNEFDGGRYYILKPAADSLQTIDSVAATLLYRVMIQFILNKGASKYYEYAVKYLIKCKKLDSHIFDWGNIRKHGDYFGDLEVTYRAKRSFWSRYQLALQINFQ